MSKKTETRNLNKQTAFSRKIGKKAEQKLKAQNNSAHNVWFGLGMMGLIGWSVVVPTLLGTALGIWLDSRYPGSYSWTLMLMLIGLGIGSLNVWFWVKKEHKEIHDKQENKDE